VIHVSVVIGTRNQAGMLARVLETFAAQDFPLDAFEVVVVDSDSGDATASVCEPRRHPFALRYVRKANTGKSSARNVALAEASGELVLLTDGDVLADPSLLSQHVRAHSDHPGSVIVGQQFMVDQPSADRTGRACLPRSWERGRRLTWRQFVTGNASLPTRVIRDVGGFDEGFVGYGYEDYELGYRIAVQGVRFVFEPAAINYHCHPVAFEDDVVRKREAGQGAVYFATRHPSWRLRAELGLTPFNRALFRAMPSDGVVSRWCRRHVHQPSLVGRVARHLVLESTFQESARRAWVDR
jgi:glycosyltransferase involved in cell wall biosynthesis